MIIPVAFLVLTLAFALATLAFGWWTVPLVSAAWTAIVRKSDRPAVIAAGAAAAGWAVLLLWTASIGPVGQVASIVGNVIGIPAVLLYIVALGLAALMGWAAATLVISAKPGGEWTGNDRRSAPAVGSDSA